MALRLTLVATIVLGLWLRVWQLDAHSLWFDEALEVGRAMQPLSQAVVARGIDQDPPLLALLLHVWLRAGTSDAWCRLPGVLAGVVAVALAGAWGRRLGGDAQGAVAAGLLALAPVAVHYGQEVNQYALVFALAIALGLALEHVLARPTGRRWAAYGLLAVVALSTHYGFGLLLAVHLAVLLAGARRGPSWRPVVAYVLVLAMSARVLWGLGLARNLSVVHVQGRFGGTSPYRELDHVLDVLWREVAVFFVVPWSGGQALHLARAVALLAVLAAVLGWRRGGAARRAVSVGFVGFLGACYVGDGLGLYPLGGRYALASLPAVVVTLAGGLATVWRVGPAGRALAAASCAALALALGVFLPQRDRVNPLMAVPREELRPVLVALDRRAVPGQAVYVYHGARPAFAKYQADGLLPEGVRVLVGRAYGHGTVAAEAERLSSMARSPGGVWLVFSHVSPGDHESMLEALVLEASPRWRLAQRIEADGAMAYLVVRRHLAGKGVAAKPIPQGSPSDGGTVGLPVAPLCAAYGRPCTRRL